MKFGGGGNGFWSGMFSRSREYWNSRREQLALQQERRGATDRGAMHRMKVQASRTGMGSQALNPERRPTMDIRRVDTGPIIRKLAAQVDAQQFANYGEGVKLRNRLREFGVSFDYDHMTRRYTVNKESLNQALNPRQVPDETIFKVVEAADRRIVGGGTPSTGQDKRSRPKQTDETKMDRATEVKAEVDLGRAVPKLENVKSLELAAEKIGTAKVDEKLGREKTTEQIERAGKVIDFQSVRASVEASGTRYLSPDSLRALRGSDAAASKEQRWLPERLDAHQTIAYAAENAFTHRDDRKHWHQDPREREKLNVELEDVRRAATEAAEREKSHKERRDLFRQEMAETVALYKQQKAAGDTLGADLTKNHHQWLAIRMNMEHAAMGIAVKSDELVRKQIQFQDLKNGGLWKPMSEKQRASETKEHEQEVRKLAATIQHWENQFHAMHSDLQACVANGQALKDAVEKQRQMKTPALMSPEMVRQRDAEAATRGNGVAANEPSSESVRNNAEWLGRAQQASARDAMSRASEQSIPSKDKENEERREAEQRRAEAARRVSGDAPSR